MENWLILMSICTTSYIYSVIDLHHMSTRGITQSIVAISTEYTFLLKYKSSTSLKELRNLYIIGENVVVTTENFNWVNIPHDRKLIC